MSEIASFITICDDFVRFANELGATLNDGLSNSEIKIFQEEFKMLWTQIKSIYTSIPKSVGKGKEDEGLVAVQTKYSSMFKLYAKCMSKLADQQTNDSDQVSEGADQSVARFRLPPCDIPPFAGDYLSWPTFRDLFTALFLKNSKISAVEKLFILNQKTIGEANLIVKEAPLTNEGFDIAWRALVDRFENKRVLVNQQLKILFNLPTIKRESADSLRQLQRAINSCASTLTLFKIDISSWDPILVYQCSVHLPSVTVDLWEQSLKNKRDVPKWSEMTTFLSQRCETLEAVGDVYISLPTSSSRNSLSITNVVSSPNAPRKINVNMSSSESYTCKLCSKQGHPIRGCPKFLKMSIKDREAMVKKLQLCLNCFSKNHMIRDCSSTHNCFQCGKRHHTLLHRKSTLSVDGGTSTHAMPALPVTPSATPSTSNGVTRNIVNSATVTNCASIRQASVLLGTALIHVIYKGCRFIGRALLDSGSQATFVSEKFAKRLGLPTTSVKAKVLGVTNSTAADATKRVSFLLGSRLDPHFQIDVEALVLPRLSNNLPTTSLDSKFLEHSHQFQLADPQFFESSHIDVLLGADLYPALLLPGVQNNVCGSLVAQETVFGWILSGPVSTTSCQLTVLSCCAELSSIDPISKFWEIEEVPSTTPQTSSDQFCEKLYSTTTTRDDSGRYVVKLPFKESFLKTIFLGASRPRATALYTRSESRLLRQPELKSQYDQVLGEYLTLNHMVKVPPSCGNPSLSFYLPHHAVFKPDSASTKVRVVFNGSCSSSNGVSLNDVLHSGPALQSDLMILLLQWRFYKFVFTSDIRQMYRQIKLSDAHTPYQRILFRTSPSDELCEYELRTVTFGINCAPYLAIRTLLQLADDVQQQWPLATSILRENMYVDDILAGGFSVEETIAAKDQVRSALSSAGFELRKWASNSKHVLRDIPQEHILSENFLEFRDTSLAKTLGIRWDALCDEFYFSFVPGGEQISWTKRQMFSQTAKFFDPAGWLAPVIVVAKMLLQRVWLEGTDWDEALSAASTKSWISFQESIRDAPIIKIPRWIEYDPKHRLEFHVFSDASEKAYAAAIYTRIIHTSGKITVSLLVAKTRVAPTKTVSLPRLELCGALLASELVQATVPKLHGDLSQIRAWTDSTIVLAWLDKNPGHWKTFVANRVSAIQQVIPRVQWRHVESADNPADIASRGTTITELQNSNIWWHGPAWLEHHDNTWTPSPHSTTETTHELKTVSSLSTNVIKISDILDRFSSLPRALRVLSYVLRFAERTHPKSRALAVFPDVNLSIDEIRNTKFRLITAAQRAGFSQEICVLAAGNPIASSSSLKNLNPIVDKDGILRACGRLEKETTLSHDERFPIILPYDCRLTRLLVEFTHKLSIHGGNQLVLRLLRLQFWIPRVKNLIRAVIRSCKPCILYRKRTLHQLMGALPAPRVEFSRPFTHTGIDFAGPFDIRSFSGRACRISKGYVCVFVCFCTKAIHLELTSDLSAAKFLAAFQRFAARRGCPSSLYSDNGRNFVGAARELNADFIEASKSTVTTHYPLQHIKWNFIPPGAPHMGGLWEAGVKSFKQHFQKTMGNLRFTFEEFTTLLSRIEACLNSRPLSPMSDDPTDLTAITPGHFLIGSPLLAVPEPIVDSEPLSIINRWQRVKAIQCRFAVRWKHEYIKELHKRNKWQTPQPNLAEGSTVVVRDDTLPPTEWRLGRVTQVYPGSDDRVRVAEIRTNRGIITRPIVKLVALPTEQPSLESP